MLGISADKPSAQKKFKEKHNLPYSLLADEDKAVANQVGVLKDKSLYGNGKMYMGIDRTTFVISPEGKITGVITGVNPEEHATAVLAAMKWQSALSTQHSVPNVSRRPSAWSFYEVARG